MVLNRRGAYISFQNLVIAIAILGITLFIFFTYAPAYANNIFSIIRTTDCAKPSCLDCSFFIKEHCPADIELFSEKTAGSSKLKTGKLTIIFNRELEEGDAPVIAYAYCGSGSAPLESWDQTTVDYTTRGATITISNLKAGCQYALEIRAKSKDGKDIDKRHKWLAFRR